jgi:transcriptional regulator with XRE-family HTH domain
MDMKLDSGKIRELRHRKSWSQEKLAENAGLNPRTIQRVEADGTASLQTRLRLAKVFAVQPELLDAEPERETGNSANPGRLAVMLDYLDKLAASTSIPLLLLITIIYLACTAPFFSLSHSHLWFNYGIFEGLLPGWYPFLALLLPCIWIVPALPWLRYLHSRNPLQFRRHMLLLLTAVACIYLRYWQPELAMLLVTIWLYASCLSLLLSLFLPGRKRQGLRDITCASLLTYIVLGSLHDRVSLFVLGSLARWQRELPFELPWINFGDYVIRILEGLTHLIPVLLVLLLVLGSDRKQQGKDTRGNSSVKNRIADDSSDADVFRTKGMFHAST